MAHWGRAYPALHRLLDEAAERAAELGPESRDGKLLKRLVKVVMAVVLSRETGSGFRLGTLLKMLERLAG